MIIIIIIIIIIKELENFLDPQSISSLLMFIFKSTETVPIFLSTIFFLYQIW